MARKGRDLEVVVAELEQMFAGRHAIIRSPDHIKCKITGDDREVDVSIHVGQGESTKLFTVECRDRKRTEDVTWIEQLVTKRKNIGVDHTIAVSSTGFSDNAIKLANAHGILLRTAQNISLKDFLCEDNHFAARTIQIGYQVIGFAPLDESWKVIPHAQPNPEVGADWAKRRFDAPLFFGKNHGRRESVHSLMNCLISSRLQHGLSPWSLPRDPNRTLRMRNVIGLVDDVYEYKFSDRNVHVPLVQFDYALYLLVEDRIIDGVINYNVDNEKKMQALRLRGTDEQQLKVIPKEHIDMLSGWNPRENIDKGGEGSSSTQDS